MVALGSSVSKMVLAEAARPASPWISLGMMILVALPLAAAVKASSGLDLQYAVSGVGLVEELDGIGGGLLHLHNGLGLGFGLQDLACLAPSAWRMAACLAASARRMAGLLLALSHQDLGLLLALGLEDGLAALPLGPHLLLHGTS